MNYPYSSPNGYEEDLNQQIIGHLYYSLDVDASLLNIALQNTPVSLDDEASVVAHQEAPLPHTSETETDREIDWVIQDSTQLVGFESKYGDTLSENQLSEELLKLKANAGERDAILIAITHHGTRPSVVDTFEEEPVYWTNWISVAKNLHQTDEDSIDPEQRVPFRMLNDLFEVEDMEPFTGFNHHDKEQYRYFIRDLQPELDDIGLENRGKLHNWTQEKTSPAGYCRIIPKYIDIPFVEEDRPDHNDSGRPQSKRASRFAVVVDTEEHRVYAGISFQTNRIDSHRQMIQNNRSTIIDYARNQELELWIGRNSLNHRNVPPRKTDEPDKMREWLSTSGDTVLPKGEKDYIRAMFVRECTQSNPVALFEVVVETLTELRRRFLDQDEFIDSTTLVKPETTD